MDRLVPWPAVASRLAVALREGRLAKAAQDDGHRSAVAGRKKSAFCCVTHSKRPAASPHFQRVEDNTFHHSFCSEDERRYLETVSFGAKEATRLRRAASQCRRAMGYGVVRRRIDYFGASELTIFSKRGSPRKGSHSGLKRKLP